MSFLLSLLLSVGSMPSGFYLSDEGGTKKAVRNLDCVGSGVTCTATSTFGTITIAGGGGNSVSVTVAFGSGADVASTVVTGQTWVGASSVIVCAPTLLAASGRSEGQEDAVIEGLTAAVHTRVAGTGFTLTVAPRQGAASGSFVFHCIGV